MSLSAVDQVRKALADLEGFTEPDQVAEFLAAKGIKGRTATSTRCALAEYLKQNTGALVSVSHSEVLVEDSGKPCYCGWEECAYGGMDVPLPEVVGQFAARFDKGEYPHLVAEDTSREMVDI